MTEKNNLPISNTPSDEVKESVAETKANDVNNDSAIEKTQAKNRPSKLAILSIALIIALGGVGYFYGYQQTLAVKSLKNEITALKQQLSQSDKNQLQLSQLSQLQQQLTQKLSQQTQEQQKLLAQVTQSENALTVQEKSIYALHEKMLAMSKTDTNSWLIAQADYLVKLAGRKIWNDQDFVTARLLLKSADSSIAEVNDPSLLPVRTAINEDITALAAITQVDFDGIVLRLNQLASQILALSIADNSFDNGNNTDYYDNNINAETEGEITPTDNDTLTGLSNSLSDWKQNLTKSWNSFFAKFVTIEKRNDLAECLASATTDQSVKACSALAPLLAPEQEVYLRENLKLQLFIAAQAVPRHQDAIYQQSLDNVSTWVRAYFDPNSPLTKTFLTELDELAQQSFNMNIPEQLKSSAMLDKLMHTRVRNLLSQTQGD